MVPIKAAFQVQIVGLGVHVCFVANSICRCGVRFARTCSAIAFQLVLHVKQVLQITIVILCPKVSLVADPNQLDADAGFAPLPPHATLQDVVDVEFTANLAEVLPVCL